MRRRICNVFLFSLPILLLCACGNDREGDGQNLPAEGIWTSGIYLEGRQSQRLLVGDWDVTVLYAADESVSFDGLKDGDVINVYLDTILETWPAQTTVYAVEKLEDGDIQDISPELLGQLREFGWLE